MPNIRIKDIPTTASATVNGDFLPIDSTVSTRKLNAFSPTFGGNATVSGNLTVSGGTTTLADSNGSFGTLTGSYNAGNQFVRLNRIGATEHIAMYADNSTRFTNNGAETARITSTGNLLIGGTTDITGSGGLKVFGTTASTSTSSGALVVSGGVGVAKSLNVGEAVTVAGGSFAAASFYKSASLGTVLSGATGSSYDLYLTNPAGNYVLQVPTGTRNAEFAATLTTVGAITSGASISTSAPVGGAGLWELGTYSSTAPSATGYVTIEIGGTLYKLLASNV